MINGTDRAEVGHGRISEGIEPNELLQRTLEFIREQLAIWRERPDRRSVSAERKLNAQFCKHLNSRARFELPIVLFHHEEDQTADRRVDISAALSQGGFIGTMYHSIDDPFLVAEGKRLPPPGGKVRAREYVTGGEARTGGIQRFKLRLHGAQLNVAIVIGYIQKGTSEDWYHRINAWIRELSETLGFGNETWSIEEQLATLANDPIERTSTAISVHPRIAAGVSTPLTIHHFWVEMRRLN